MSDDALTLLRCQFGAYVGVIAVLPMLYAFQIIDSAMWLRLIATASIIHVGIIATWQRCRIGA